MQRITITDQKPKESFTHRVMTESELLSYGLIQPKRVLPVFRDPSTRDKDREKLVNAIASYKKLKANPSAYKDGQEEIIKQFMKNTLPKWGSFIFQGVGI